MAADPGRSEDAPPAEDTDFQRMIAHIGGKERIYLVSDACRTEEERGKHAGVLQEFIQDMFNNGTGQHLRSSPGDAAGESDACCAAEPARCKEEASPVARPGGPGLMGTKPAGEEEEKTRNGDAAAAAAAQRTATSSVNMCSLKRTIDVPIIIFLFRQEFLAEGSNEVCVKEILKDVSARTKRASSSRPGLIGLTRTTTLEDGETRRCVQLLERLMRAVFRKHAPEAIWVGSFTPRTEVAVLSVKKHACRVFYSSQTAAGATGSKEEGIPLKTNSLSAEPHVDGETAGRDS